MNQPVATPKTVTVVSRAYSISEGTIGPDYVKFTVTEESLARLESLATTCETHNLSQIRFSALPDAWGPLGIDEQLLLRDGEVCISSDGIFWYADTCEDGCGIESEGQHLPYLRRQFDDAQNGAVLFLLDCDKIIDLYRRDHEASEEAASA